ncbi:nuclear transport factor 2 family protein [Streptomyces nigra]
MDAAERLSAIEDPRRLMARYVYCADHRRWQDLASLDGNRPVNILY